MKKQHGMTLIEVLVALSVFALTAGAIMTSVMNTINGIEGLEETYLAQMVANNVLVEQKLIKRWPNNSWVNDKVELGDRTWYYRYRGQDTMDSNFKAIEVEVFNTSKTNTATPVGYIKSYVSR